MPEVHREAVFVFQIYKPPREHGPAHVHVHKSGHSVVIHLGDANTPAFPLRIAGMSARNVVKAVHIAERNRAKLLTQWKRHHGT